MKFSEVYYVPNFAGLYCLLDGHKRGLMIESIVDGRRTFLSDRNTISNLALCGVYIKADAAYDIKETIIPLEEVFKKMKASALPCPSSKAGKKEIVAFFKNIITNLDEERNHASFFQKIINWFNLLDGKVDFCAEEETIHNS